MYSKCDQKINYDNLKCSEMNKSPCILKLQIVENVLGANELLVVVMGSASTTNHSLLTYYLETCYIEPNYVFYYEFVEFVKVQPNMLLSFEI